MKTRSLFLILVPLVMLSACSAPAASGQYPGPDSTQVATGALSYPAPEDLPQNEREVPRVSIEDAKAALESGAAIVVDVRSPAAFEVSHIPGAVNVPLGEIERNPTGLTFPRHRWIITYCT